MNRESSSSVVGGEEALRLFALPFNDLAGEDMLYSIVRRGRKEGKMRGKLSSLRFKPFTRLGFEYTSKS